MGMTYEEIQVAIESLPFPQNTKIRKHLKKKYEYLLSTYSTNTESFISHINALYHMKKSHQAILTPGIIELGKERKSEYQRIVSEIKNETYIFTTDPNFAKACTSNKTLHVTYDANQINLFRKAKSILNEDFALLIEGRFRQSCSDSIV